MPLPLAPSPADDPVAVIGEVGIFVPENDIQIVNTYLTGVTTMVDTRAYERQMNAVTTAVWTHPTRTNANIIVPGNVTVSGNVVYYTGSTNTTATYYSSAAGTVIFTNTGDNHWVMPPNWEAQQAKRARQYQRDRRASVHKAKSAIKKALKLIDNMGFGDEIRIFIGGDEIVIDNPDSIFKFVLKRGASLIDRTINPGHGTPYGLELLTKDDVHVANLCVYLPNTPVLDQVLAVALYIKSGDEEEVLTKANWFSPSRDEGIKRLVHDYNPKFGKKIGYRPERTEPEVEGCFFTGELAQNLIVTNNVNHYFVQHQ